MQQMKLQLFFCLISGLCVGAGAMDMVLDDFNGGAGPLSGSTPLEDIYGEGWQSANANWSLQCSADGWLEATANGQFNSIRLPRQGDKAIATVRADYSGSPGDGSWLAFGFTAGVHNLFSGSGPWINIRGNGAIRLFGGSGTSNLLASATVAYTGGTVPVEFVYDKNTATASLWFNNELVFEQVPIVNSEADDPCIDYFTVHYNTSTATAGHRLDNLGVELVPRPYPLRELPINYTIDVPAPGTGDSSEILRQAIADAVAKVAEGNIVEIRLAQDATYYLGEEGEDTDPNTQWMGDPWMTFLNTSNIVFNGCNSMLVNRNFSRRIFAVNGCKNIIIQNLKADCAQPPFAQGIIREVGLTTYNGATREYLDLDIDPAFPLPDSAAFTFYDAASDSHKNWFNDDADGKTWGYALDPVINGRVRDGAHMHIFQDAFFKVGNDPADARRYRIIAKNRTESLRPLDRYVCHGRAGGFCRPYGSIRITLQNVTVFASGEGYFQGGSFNSELAMLNCRAEIKPGHWKSSNAGMMGSGIARIGAWIEDCYFEGTSDDLMNNLSRLYMPSTNEGDLTFTLRRWIFDRGIFGGVELAGFTFIPGDAVRFINGTTGEVLADRTVTSVSADGQTITIDTPVTGIELLDQTLMNLGCTQVINLSLAAGAVVRNTTIRNCRAYIRPGSAMLIDGCVMDAAQGIVIHSYTAEKYKVAGPSGMIVIANSVFKNMGGPLLSQPAIHSYVRCYSPSNVGGVASVGHQNFSDILITRNQFRGWNNEAAISLGNARDVRIIGNEFLFPTTNTLGVVRLFSTAGVLLENNIRRGIPSGIPYLYADEYCSGIENRDETSGFLFQLLSR